MRTEQEVFTIAATHLIAQGVKSYGKLIDPEDPGGPPSGACMYRGPSGTSCAVGCLIPDDSYTPNMEYMQARQLLERFPGTKKYLGDNYDLLRHLQRIHDHHTTSEWHYELSNLARDYDLEMPA